MTKKILKRTLKVSTLKVFNPQNTDELTLKLFKPEKFSYSYRNLIP